MEKGTLARWLVSIGDRVKPGDLIAEIETDKATMEFESAEEGRITALLVPEGSENVAVGSVIARISETNDVADVAAQQAPDPAPSVPPLVIVEEPPAPVTGIIATPLARRIAAARQIALDGIRGTGARGKIVKADLGLEPAAVTEAPAQPRPEAIAPPPAGVPVDTIKLSGMRKTIARRLSDSKQSVPHFYLTVRCQLDALLRLRVELNASLAERGIKLSVNDLLIKAMARALMDVPDANVQFGGDVLHRFGRADIAMAVAVDGGLVTPVIKNADSLSLSAIARDSQQMAARARAGQLLPEDYQGGTASLSNLGMFGIDEIVPVINPPQALILGVGAGIEQPWAVGGALGLATIMAATGSFDHRAIDGATGAQFMAAFRNYVETPIRLCS
jgi:pyruvate dehydrogenase E2 component (dihydrolipoamide acetyltransferase)